MSVILAYTDDIPEVVVGCELWDRLVDRFGLSDNGIALDFCELSPESMYALRRWPGTDEVVAAIETHKAVKIRPENPDDRS